MCVRCASIPRVSNELSFEKKKGNERKRRGKKRDRSMLRRIERTSEDEGDAHKSRTAHTENTHRHVFR